MFSSSLPPELWLHVFRWATVSPITPSLRSTTYTPFETASIDTQDDALKTKYMLVRVCRQWRNLALDLLYEDVRMKHPENLQRTLTGGNKRDAGTGYGRWVRRAYLPFSGSAVTSCKKPLSAVEVLKGCPRLETLVRLTPFTSASDMQARFEFEADCPSLPSLKRLDWWHHNEAARTGGINCLADVLQAAPNVQYVSLGGEVWMSFLHSSRVELPYLTTMRLMRMNVLFVQQICRWSLPSLQHLVLDTMNNPATLSSFWETYGAQLRTVELGASLKYFIYDALSQILRECPNLEELNYYVNFTAKPLLTEHSALATVGLHAHENAMLPFGCDSSWEHLEQHFSMLALGSFPALRRVMLYGDWRAVVEDARFSYMTHPLRNRGCAVEWVRPY